MVRAGRRSKDGSPVFTKHDLFPDLVSETHALIAADINGDGLKDLVTGKRFWSHGKNEPGSDKPARIYWFEASRGPDGKITFTPREIDDQSGIGTQFVVADYNGDGRLDVVTANKKGVFLFDQVHRANDLQGLSLDHAHVGADHRRNCSPCGWVSRTCRVASSDAKRREGPPIAIRLSE